MKTIIKISLIILSIGSLVKTQSVYDCINRSFSLNCKQLLFKCIDTPQCSYQLHQNAQHINLVKQSYASDFPPLFFSNPGAVDLYKCLKKDCDLPQIDTTYPSTLPYDYCLIEVYDICEGNLENVYQDKQSETIMSCYRKYCKKPVNLNKEYVKQ